MQVGMQKAVRQVGKNADRQTDRGTERQIYKYAYTVDIKDLGPTGILYTDIDWHKQTNKQTEQKCRKVDRKIDRCTERQMLNIWT
jgi:hypothetical protein